MKDELLADDINLVLMASRMKISISFQSILLEFVIKLLRDSDGEVSIGRKGLWLLINELKGFYSTLINFLQLVSLLLCARLTPIEKCCETK